MRTTYMAKPTEVERKWYIFDAEGQTLGRLSSVIASVLRGKHKPTFTPNVDCGDHVIVINADKIELSGNKLEQKEYIRYSGYVGGLRRTKYKDLLEKRPELAIEVAVKGMLPKNRLGAKMFTKLNVYQGSEHPHEAQKPEVWQGWEGGSK